MSTADTPSPVTAADFGTAPAASVMAECLRVQSDVRSRSALARLFGRSPLSNDSRSWYRGALGELKVARRLEALRPEWVVLHSVPVGTRGSDIDHVVIGAAGVFTINTKMHEDAKVWVGSRRLLVNGQPQDHLRNSRHEAARARKILSTATGIDVPVSAVVAIEGAKELTIREHPGDVEVLRGPALARWLRKQPARLDADAVDRIVEAAGRSETWSPIAGSPVDEPAFAALRREVIAAARVRMAWGAAIVIGILGASAPIVLDTLSRMNLG